MPTGYTAPIYDGESFTPAQYILSCARAFGNFAGPNRDAPLSSEIPPQEMPDPYHRDKMMAAAVKLGAALEMSQSETEAAAQEAHAKDLADWQEWKAKQERMRREYDAMAASIEAWEPPTPDHSELKAFCLSQLRDSIRFDCHDDDAFYPRPAVVHWEVWKAERVRKARNDVAYHAERYGAEVARTNERNAWTRALVHSLPETGGGAE